MMNDRHRLALGYVGHASFPKKNANCLQALQMCEAFTRIGCQVEMTVPDILSSREEIALRYHLHEFKDITPITPGKEDCGRCVYQIKAAALHRRNGKDALYTRSGYAFFWGMLIGIPAFWEVHDVGSSVGSKFWPILRQMLRCRHSWGIITISNALKEVLVGQGGIPPGKVLVSHDAADLELFRAAGVFNPEESKVEAGYKPEDFLAVYSGKFELCRGIEDIFYAAARLPDVKFLMIGAKPEDFTKYKSQIEGLKNLKVMGFIDHAEVPKYLRMADALLSPYRSDTPTIAFCSSLKIPEYMAMRKPIVISDFPVFREVLEAGRDCVYFKKDDPDAFVAALQQVKASPDLAAAVSANAFEKSRELSWDNRARNIIGFIERQISR
ncbi:MAG: glycosyltransferase family 4 protein [Victivallales bacterium]